MSSIIIKYLIEFINSLRKLSHEIIVTIDANKTFNDLNNELAKLCTKYKLRDHIIIWHGVEWEPST